MKHPKMRAFPVSVTALSLLVNSAMAQTTNLNVSASSDQNYTINAQSDPVLTVQRGLTYSFNVSAFGHPFYIKTIPSTGSGNAYNNGVTGQGTEFGSVTFTVPLDAPNTLYYHCSEHLNMGNQINVINPPNTPPIVSITNPPDGSVFIAPVSIAVEVSATDTGGSVTNVEFLVNGGFLANDNQPPFSILTPPLGQGVYTLSAIASDNLGAKATNTISITVNAPANIPPTVSINSPAVDAKFLAPASLNLTTTTGDSDGTVTNVRFFSGGNQVGSVASPPFEFALNNLAAGNYALNAAADDSAGASTTSSIVNVFILTNAILSSPLFSNGQFQFTVTGIAGQTYISENSVDFSNWIAFSTNVAPSNVFDVVCSGSTNINAFRVRQDLN